MGGAAWLQGMAATGRPAHTVEKLVGRPARVRAVRRGRDHYCKARPPAYEESGHAAVSRLGSRVQSPFGPLSCTRHSGFVSQVLERFRRQERGSC